MKLPFTEVSDIAPDPHTPELFYPLQIYTPTAKDARNNSSRTAIVNGTSLDLPMKYHGAYMLKTILETIVVLEKPIYARKNDDNDDYSIVSYASCLQAVVDAGGVIVDYPKRYDGGIPEHEKALRFDGYRFFINPTSFYTKDKYHKLHCYREEYLYFYFMFPFSTMNFEAIALHDLDTKTE